MSASKHGNTKAYLAIGLIRLLGLLPFRLLQWLGAGLGRLQWRLNTRMAKVAKRNIAACFPNLGEAEQLEMAKISIIETGRSLIETAKVWTWPAKSGEKHIIEIHGEELLHQAKKEGKGIIWVTLHHGNWEMIPFFFASRTELTAMYKPTQMPAFDKWMTESRERFGVSMVEADRKGVMKLIHEIKANRDILLLPDQEPSRTSGVFAPFFNVPALTGKLTTHLAMANPDAAIIFIYVIRINGGYRINLVQGDQAIADSDFVTSATALNEGLEKCILDQPQYFQWGYKRFKQRPEGQPKFYQGY